jgi:hypothetical protein
VRGTSTGQNAITAADVGLTDGPAPATPKTNPPAAPTTPAPTTPGGTTPPVPARPAGVAFGTVGTVTPTGFTVVEGNGTTVTVTTSAATKFVKTVDVSLAELTLGQPVVVGGTANADGSFDATQVGQGGAGLGIRGGPGSGGPGFGGPAFGGGGPGFGGGPGGGRGGQHRFGGPGPAGGGPAAPATTPTTPSTVA